MLGRGLLARPDLALEIKSASEGLHYKRNTWPTTLHLVEALFEDSILNCAPRHVGGPIKQWLGYLRREYQEAQLLFERIKRLNTAADITAALDEHRHYLAIAA
jgi:tRNA-dihydrouridine synthase C